MFSVSRRSFLKGAVTAVGATAFGSLIACSPKPDNTNEATSVTDAGGTTAASNHQTLDPTQAVWPVNESFEIVAAGEGQIAFVADPIPTSEIVSTHDVDVVVCGFGSSGGATALACADNGLKTVVVEKNAAPHYITAGMGGTSSKVHKHWGMTYDTDQWLADAIIDSAFQGDITLYKHWLDTNGEAVDWFIDHFDNKNLDDYKLAFNSADFADFREPYAKTSYSRSWNTAFNLPYAGGQELPSVMEGIVSAGGVEIRYECPACQLVTDASGAVSGVIVKSTNGYEQYNAAKAVVLATGGYEFNAEMLKQRCRPRGIPGHWIASSTGNTGDGHQMGLAVGAIEDDYPHAIMLDPEQLMPFLRVNSTGRRFMAEYEPYGHMALGIQAQPGGYCFCLADSQMVTKIEKLWTPATSAFGTKEMWAAGAMSDAAFKADTLEELADLMGVPADAFVETVNHWNGMVAAGVDSDFGFPGEMMTTIDTPPFYATKESSSGLCSVGGLLVNNSCQVLNAQRQPIPGLYAAGLTSGGMFYNTYPHNLNCLSTTRNVEMGYTIAKVLSS